MFTRVLVAISLVSMSGLSACKKQAPGPETRRSAPEKRVPKARKAPAKAPAKSAGVSDKEWKKRGKAVAMAAFGKLAPALMKGMQAGGVKNAVSVCKVQAGPITEGVAKTHNVMLQRVSHRPRNPANQASKEELVIIQDYIKKGKAGQKLGPVLKKIGKEKVVFYAPIKLMMPTCVKCHGTPGKGIKKADYKVIKKHYPKDKAIGFKLGELRGLWKVTFALKAPAPKK